MSQNDTLDAKQVTTAHALLRGASITAAAEEAGVNRSTVHRWLRQDYAFRAFLNSGKQAIAEAAIASLVGVAGRATEVVHAAVSEGDVRVSVDILKGLGLLNGQPRDFGPCDAGELEAAEENRRAARREHLFLESLALAAR